ncbi:uracil/xanthine transporter [Paenibacillus sp. FA6]|uniref:uracil/xanthine transporter n=1 Tax=Paenibacillus sp. FA6 TaxID=3413029 RepID=UPI003F659410
MKEITSRVTIFASIQWVFFIFANIVVVPISIGLAFDLPPHEVATILRSSLIVTGVACILQGLIGHRFPLMEGHSGVMWALILNLCLSAPTLGLSLVEIGGGIATGMLLAGALIMILAACNAIPFIRKIFGPMVMNVFLLLLTFQLAFIFFKGMLTVNEDGTLDLPITLFSLGIAIFVALLKIKGSKNIGNFSLLIGIVVGWSLYAMFFPTANSLSGNEVGVFSIFPLGSPNLQFGIITITFLGCFINMSNTIASLQAASKLLNEKASTSQYRNSLFLTGAYCMVASLFGLVSYAPFASSIGFLESTQIFHRKPFFIGGALIIILGIIPSLGVMLATLPISVGNAVLFIAYLQLLGTSFKSLKGYTFDSITIHRVAAPVLIGVSLMSIDVKLFANLPAVVQPIISNGFIMGVLISLIMETTIKWGDIDKKILT